MKIWVAILLVGLLVFGTFATVHSSSSAPAPGKERTWRCLPQIGGPNYIPDVIPDIGPGGKGILVSEDVALRLEGRGWQCSEVYP